MSRSEKHQMKRVLLVNLTQIYGGGEVYYAKLVRLLSGQIGFDAVVANSKLHTELLALGVHSYLLPESDTSSPAKKLCSALIQVKRLISDNKIDTVHLNGPGPARIAPLLRITGQDFVIARHTSLDLQFALAKDISYKFCTRLARVTVCVSHYLAEQHSFLSSDKVVVIPNWVATSTPKLITKSNSQLFKLLYVGRIERQKGIFDLLDAISCLDSCHLDILGDGPDLLEAKDFASELRLNHVTFHGFVQDVNSWMLDSDALIQPSHSEGSSLVMLEAMSMGLPCIVSDIPVLRELAMEGRTAILFKCGDASDLKEKIKSLSNSLEYRHSLIESAHSMVVNSYSPEIVRKAYLELFRAN